ncbi:MAG: hypothetical protein PVG20_00135 [Thioalkalispiraceae bacterium]|jgi:hypothetical protein
MIEVSSPIDSQQELVWASRLVECMNDMGKHHTNAVLLSLEGNKTIKPYQRYPETPYYFGNKHWRAFYHCHQSPEQITGEHGHYHFFTRVNTDSEWSHVVAMGMSNHGQPTRLFTTNLWVTDGKWFPANLLMPQLTLLANSQDDSLATNWLKYVLLLFQSEISELLIIRDNKVSQLFPNYHEQCFLDRSIYYLSQQTINLNEQLCDVFSINSADRSSRLPL